MSMLRPFLINNNVLGVSGRCCHGLTYSHGVGKLGRDVESPLKENIDKNIFYVSETCNRGPLMLNTEKLKELKYLDEHNYFLDNSDHDLFARGFYFKSWICGYVPIEFNAPLVNGSTRKQRDSINQKMYLYKKSTCLEKGFLDFYLKTLPKSRPIYTIKI